MTKKDIDYIERNDCETYRLSGQEIARILDDCYCGIDTLKYTIRYKNGDNRLKKIRWVLANFHTTYGIARRIVIHANNFSAWYGYYSK